MKIWTIILAAGEGSRFGGPKALAPWGDGTLLTHAIDAAPQKENVVVVTGAHENLIQQALEETAHVYNRSWKDGMGTSIATGLSFASLQGADIAIIVPVDQPFITQEYLKKLASQSSVEKRCILTRDGDIQGPPAAITASSFEKLSHLKGRGLKSNLSEYGLCDGPGMLRDVDTQEDLQRFTSMM